MPPISLRMQMGKSSRTLFNEGGLGGRDTLLMLYLPDSVILFPQTSSFWPDQLRATLRSVSIA